MFKKLMQQKKEKNFESNEFKELLRTSYFIHKNMNTFDFFGSTYFTKSALNGIVYTGMSQPTFSEITDLNHFLDNFDTVDMLFLFNENDKIEIYVWDYSSHTVFNNRLEVRLKNGSTKTIYFN